MAKRPSRATIELFEALWRDIDKRATSTESARPVNPFLWGYKKVSSVIKLPDVRLPRKPKDAKYLRIGCVSLPAIEDFTIKKMSTAIHVTPSVDTEACERGLVTYPNSVAEQMRDQLKRGVRACIKDLNADIICVNELAFPVFENVGGPDPDTATALTKLANEHNVLIFGGSCHDHRTLFNTTWIFYPGCPESGAQYHKQVSAWRVGELVSVPARRNARWVEAFGFKICVLTCIDIADFAAVAAVVRLDENCDILFLPSYTPKIERMKEILLAMSEALRGAVVFTNCVGEEYATSTSCCLFGTWAKEPAQVRRLPPGGRISMYEIDCGDFRRIRDHSGSEPNEALRWLFGMNTAASITAPFS